MTKTIFFSISLISFIAILFTGIPGMSPVQNATFAIFVFAAVMWVSEAVPLYMTSLMILFLEGLLLPRFSDDISFNDLTSSFFSPILLLFLGGFAIARSLHSYGLDERIARTIVKKSSGRPFYFLLSIMAVTAFLSMWMSNTAATALMIAVPLPLLKGMDPGDKFRIAIMLGVPFAANVGGIGTPIGTPPNAIALSHLREYGIEISFFKWMLITMPILILTLTFIAILLYKTFPPILKTLPLISADFKTLHRKEWFVILIIVTTVMFWLTTPLHNMSSYLIGLFPVVFLFGTGLLPRDHFQRLGWDILMLMGGGISLGYAIQKSGLDKWILDKIGLGSVPAMVAILVAVVTAAVISNFMSNTSAAALVIPLAAGLSPANPALAAVAVAIGASSAMILPVSTPPNAIAYGSEFFSIKDMIKTGSVIFFFMLLMVTLSLFFLWRFLL